MYKKGIILRRQDRDPAPFYCQIQNLPAGYIILLNEMRIDQETGKKSASKQTLTMFMEHSEKTESILAHYNDDFSKFAKSLIISIDN